MRKTLLCLSTIAVLALAAASPPERHDGLSAGVSSTHVLDAVLPLATVEAPVVLEAAPLMFQIADVSARALPSPFVASSEVLAVRHRERADLVLEAQRYVVQRLGRHWRTGYRPGRFEGATFARMTPDAGVRNLDLISCG